MKKILLISTIFTILISCNFSNENYLLKKENDSLKQKINDLVIKTTNYEYKPLFVERANTVNIGEQYEANIFIAAYDSTHPPIVVIGQFIPERQEFYSSGDTLKYNKEFQTFIYKKQAKEKGKHSWCAKIIYPFSKDVNVNYIVGEYDVK